MIAFSSEKKMLGIGLMSGTSVDGLDISAAYYSKKKDKYSFEFINGKTVLYNNEWKEKLLNAEYLSARDLQKLQVDFAKFCGEEVNIFLEKNHLQANFIASHGHTVFHQPELGYTLQIGCGATIAAKTGILTISDFRQKDVALGGQGAPLVPIGDLYLFSDYNICINLGGFANVSLKKNGSIVAFDICPLNIVLNELCKKINLPYDNEGIIARNGKLDNNLLKQLNEIEFYKSQHPKSLGAEWVKDKITPLLKNFEEEISIYDLICTYTEHAATQIANKIPENSNKVLISGGGAFNKYLLERIQLKTQAQIYVPELNIINYKEAVVFGFIGYLRIHSEINVLKSVTGAKKDSCSGVIH
jgi:anhydro-N-acetylmuramic acid kinase